MKRGEIYLANLPVISGTSIQNGVRPVIVVSNEQCNLHSSVINIVPITSKLNKTNVPTHVTISTECGLKMESVALCEQSMLVSKDALFRKIGECDSRTISKISMGILVQFGLLQFTFLSNVIGFLQKKRMQKQELACA
jgi:mRNA interferase MazF